MQHSTPGEFSSFRVFIENFKRAAERAVATTVETKDELRESWNIDWPANEGELRRLQRVLGIAINQLAHKDREMERYRHLLHKQFKHHRGQLEHVHAAMDLISKEIHLEEFVEYDEREIHGEVRQEEKRLHFMLRKTAAALRRHNQPDHETLSQAYHLIEQVLVKIERNERKLVEALVAILNDEHRMAA